VNQICARRLRGRSRCPARASQAAQPDARRSVAQGSCARSFVAGAAFRRWTPGSAAIQANRVVRVAKKHLDQRGYRRGRLLTQAPRARAASRATNECRVFLAPVSARLYIRSVSGARSIQRHNRALRRNRDSIIPEHVHQQRNGRGTDTADDRESLRCRPSLRPLRNRLSRGSERPAPGPQGSFSALVARPFGLWPATILPSQMPGGVSLDRSDSLEAATPESSETMPQFRKSADD